MTATRRCPRFRPRLPGGAEADARHCTKPQYFIPVHGEYRMLVQARRDLASVEMGVEPKNVLVAEIGEVRSRSPSAACRATEQSVAGGRRLLVDGTGHR
ncbi:MAG: hypothetical protein ACLUNO_02955 [Oscillospiraceae bacterium]